MYYLPYKDLELFKFEIEFNWHSLVLEGRQEVDIELHEIIPLLEYRILHKRLQFQRQLMPKPASHRDRGGLPLRFLAL